VSIYRVRLTPHVISIVIVNSIMNARMNSVFILVYYAMGLVVVPSYHVVD